MSRENVELVYQGSEAFNRRDIDAFLALFDPDVEFISRFIELEGGEPYRGRDGIRSWWQKVSGVWRDLSLEIEEVRDLGEVTATRVRLRGHGMESNAPWEQRQWHVMEWRRGKVTRWRIFMGKAEALEAAGLEEQAMTEENVEVVRRGYDAYNRGDLKAFGELLTPDAIAHPLPYWPEAGARHGRDEILRLLMEIREPLERNEAAPEKIVEGNDHVVAAHLWRGVVEGTKDEVEGRVGMMVTLREGKIAELRWFRSFAEALEAAGLEE